MEKKTNKKVLHIPLVALLFFLLISQLAGAQVPELMSYQAVIRNADGELIINKSISVRISIKKGLNYSKAVYVETHTTETNENGMVSLKVGGGNPISGTFSQIAWEDGSNFIMTEIDTEGGSNYTISFTNQLLSVPYALVSKTALDAATKSYVNDLIYQLYDQGVLKVKDIDGNSYKVTKIGNQLWMAENLRTTRFANGNAITDKTNGGVDPHSTAPWYSAYDPTEVYDISTYQEIIDSYGLLYNGYAINNIRGVCPAGWRIPSIEDWDELFDYLITSNAGVDSTNVANLLKSCRQKDSPLGGSCDVSEHPYWHQSPEHYGTDKYGFSALPGGFRGGDWSLALNVYGRWWSSTTNVARNLTIRMSIEGGSAEKFLSDWGTMGLSVRCMKDMND